MLFAIQSIKLSKKIALDYRNIQRLVFTRMGDLKDASKYEALFLGFIEQIWCKSARQEQLINNDERLQVAQNLSNRLTNPKTPNKSII